MTNDQLWRHKDGCVDVLPLNKDIFFGPLKVSNAIRLHGLEKGINKAILKTRRSHDKSLMKTNKVTAGNYYNCYL